MLTQQTLKEVIEYDPITGLFVWIVDKGYRAMIGDVAGSLNTDGYVRIFVNGKRYYAHILAWFYTHGYFPENDLDHIDRNKANNSLSNLREVSRQCNNRNCGVQNNNNSGVTGVCWDKYCNKFIARIKVDGITRYLGLSPCLIEASAYRYAAEQCLGWLDCSINSSAGKYLANGITQNVKTK